MQDICAQLLLYQRDPGSVDGPTPTDEPSETVLAQHGRLTLGRDRLGTGTGPSSLGMTGTVATLIGRLMPSSASARVGTSRADGPLRHPPLSSNGGIQSRHCVTDGQGMG